MKKLLIIIATFWLLLGLNYEASAWINVANYGDTGWQTFTYTAGAGGFTGTVGFVVSNVKDTGAYPELLLDNLSQGGGENNRGFEDGLTGYTLTIDSTGESFGNVSESVTANSYTTYTPTEGSFFADLQGLSTGVDTSQFSNASGQAGTVGSILETAITLEPGGQFSFDWAFLANDKSPWNDFALFYLKDQSGTVVFSVGLAQIAAAPAPPIQAMVLLLGTCLFGLVSLSWRSKRPGGRELCLKRGRRII
jgi:hypothetical protein